MDALPAAIRALDNVGADQAGAISTLALAAQNVLANVSGAAPHVEPRSLRDVIYVGRHVLGAVDKKFLQGLDANYGFLRHIPESETLARSEHISKLLGAAFASAATASPDPLEALRDDRNLRNRRPRRDFVTASQLAGRGGPVLQ